MTKYVLAGGYAGKAEDGGAAFTKEIVNGFDQPVRILDCLFARPQETWKEVFQKDTLFFTSKLRQKVILELAEPARFVEQVKKADVIYFRGGRTAVLINVLKECNGWEKGLQEKTVAGTSAGTNFLARYYYSLDSLEICNGLNILPIKTLVHYKSDYNAPNINWDKVYQELKEFGEDLPIVTLPEGAFEVIQG